MQERSGKRTCGNSRTIDGTPTLGEVAYKLERLNRLGKPVTVAQILEIKFPLCGESIELDGFEYGVCVRSKGHPGPHRSYFYMNIGMDPRRLDTSVDD